MGADVSARWRDAVRKPHRTLSSATHRNLITGVTTALDIVDGSVTVDTTQQTRRSLDLTLEPSETLFNLLDTPGGEITVRQALWYWDGAIEWIPQGVFVVDSATIGYAPGDSITVNAPDRWVKVQRNRLGLSRSSVRTNPAYQEITRLFTGAWPGSDYPFPGWAPGSPDTTATTRVGSIVYDDGDREGAIVQYLTDNSLQLFFDANGLGVLRPTVTLTDSSVPVWTIDAGANGIMIAADRSRDMSRLRNAIFVQSSATDVVVPAQFVQNTTIGDPYSVNGPLGAVVYDYTSSTLRNSAQALAAGKTQLALQLGEAKQLTLGSVPNPALDADDVILVNLPQTGWNTPGASEVHIIDSVTHPLNPGSTDGQQITTRSTRPDTDGS